MEQPGDLEEMLGSLTSLDRDEIADAIQEIGFECTDCGACCRGEDDEHVATVFPDEVRRLQRVDESWNDVVQPMPFGLDEEGNGTTLEWSLQVDGCGDCRFLEIDGDESRCSRYADRPSICRTYPFTLTASPEAPPQGAVVDEAGPIQAHECEGLGRDIDRDRALAMADELLERAETSIDEAMDVRSHLHQESPTTTETTVIDSEGYKRADGTPLNDASKQR